MVIGITGKYCSGKSFLATLFEQCGYTHIDVDVIGHQALEYKKDILIHEFGSCIVCSSTNLIDRKMLGHIVFSDKSGKKLQRLEHIVHPWMVQKIKALIYNEKENYIISAALLHRMRLDTLCDIVIFVETNIILRIIRAWRRDKVSFFDILKRISKQNDIPTKKMLKQTGKTTDTLFIRGVHSISTYKKKLFHYLYKE